MDLSLLTTLEKRLHEAKQFSEVWDYFLTHFGEKQEFFGLGERATDSFLEGVLKEIGKELFGRPVRVHNTALMRLPDYGFIHGSVNLGDRMASVIYFENIHKGMLAVIWSLRTSEMKYVRFTGRALYDQLNRSEN